MAHAYTIISMTNTSLPVADPVVNIVGTVDGVQVEIQVWNSALQPHLGSAISFETFIAPLLLAAVPPTPAAVNAPILSFSL